ncbi:MAG TPA: c-type cytochrome [Stellaceae bacterium]|jgi:cytochrome c|nr:c-type cytochrome [Stellaceae bacterium]
MRYGSTLIVLAVGIVATVGTASAQYVPRFSLLRAEQAAGRKLFDDHCAACHTQSPGTRVVFGPNLDGVVGRRAASAAGFPYSEALQKSGLVWTEDNLRKWIADSAQMVPGTLMPHASITDPAEQIYVIAYLKTLKGSAPR